MEMVHAAFWDGLHEGEEFLLAHEFQVWKHFF